MWLAIWLLLDFVGLHTEPPQNHAAAVESIEISELLCSDKSWSCRDAHRIAHCESRMNPRAVSPVNRNGSQDFGVMQLNDSTWATYFGTYLWHQVLDPQKNIAMAHHIFVLYGWRPWSCRGNI